MKEETKQSLNLVLDVLSKALVETNTLIAIQVDKKDFNKSKIAFVDFDSVASKKYDGFTVEIDELNKGIINKYKG